MPPTYTVFFDEPVLRSDQKHLRSLDEQTEPVKRIKRDDDDTSKMGHVSSTDAPAVPALLPQSFLLPLTGVNDPNRIVDDIIQKYTPERLDVKKELEKIQLNRSIPKREESVDIANDRVRSHPLLPAVVEFIIACKREGISPSSQTFGFLQEAKHEEVDLSLDHFLGIQDIRPDDGDTNEPFKAKVAEIQARYQEELDKLDGICTIFSSQIFEILKDQSTIRPISSEEMMFKIRNIQSKFDVLRGQLKRNVCSAIVAMDRAYHDNKGKRGIFSDQTKSHLSEWFFDHIADPYPTEEEKIILCSKTGLTMTQVNNWFGNMRIRYKRKCLSSLEEDK